MRSYCRAQGTILITSCDKPEWNSMQNNVYLYTYICVCVSHFVVQQKLTQHKSKKKSKPTIFQ